MKREKKEQDQTKRRNRSVTERNTKRGRRGTKYKRAAVAQRGCQVQSGVGQQDSQGAATGGESWETCVSCLLRLQTTSLCFTGPFFPSTHCQPPSQTSPPPTAPHHPEKNTRGYLRTCREGLGDGGGEAEDGGMSGKVKELQTDEDINRMSEGKGMKEKEEQKQKEKSNDKRKP